MIKLNFYIRSSLIFLFVVFMFSGCPNFNLAGQKHCSQYKYDKNRNIWIDAFGKAVSSCTIADGQNIFTFFPDKGCDYWREAYNIDKTVQFVELPIKTGSGQHATVQKYCVKQRYLSLDHSNQVVLIDEGVFCLKEVAKDEYNFTSCEGVKKKNPQQSEIENTDSN